MPNWTATSIQWDCDEKTNEEIKALVKSDKQDFDFEKLIPMPDDIFRGNLGQAEEKLYGNKTWYAWCPEHWGTKWNACDSYLQDYQAQFSTAWSPALPIFAELSRRFPSVEFDIQWDDEYDGSRYNTTYLNGESLYEEITEAINLKCQCGGEWSGHLDDVPECWDCGEEIPFDQVVE